MRTLNLKLAVFTSFALGALVTSPLALADSTVVTAKDPRPALKRELQILDGMSKYLDKPFTPRLKTIATVVQDALTTVNSHSNIAHRESVQAIQRVVLVFRYSTTFFDQITSGLEKDNVGELQLQTENLSTDFGFDLAEGANIIELILRQIYTITGQLLGADLGDSLRGDLTALLPVLGRGIAVATTGDRPNAYQAADELYLKISALYDKFNKISISQTNFSLVQELVQLNEFYASYGQVNTRLKKGGTEK